MDGMRIDIVFINGEDKAGSFFQAAFYFDFALMQSDKFLDE